MMKRIGLAAALTAAAFGIAPARAATTIGATGNRGLQIQLYDRVGQTFAATGSTLSSFGFELSTVNSTANTALTFTLSRGAGFDGEVVTTRSVVAPLGALRSSFWQDFDLAGTSLVPGGIYTAFLSAASTRLAVRYGPSLPGDGVDAYAGGSLVTAVPQTGYCLTGPCDANFRFTTADVAAVPEPATWAMVLVGFGGVGFAMRRRGRKASAIKTVNV